jgi:hypothetical protein
MRVLLVSVLPLAQILRSWRARRPAVGVTLTQVSRVTPWESMTQRRTCFSFHFCTPEFDCGLVAFWMVHPIHPGHCFYHMQAYLVIRTAEVAGICRHQYASRLKYSSTVHFSILLSQYEENWRNYITTALLKNLTSVQQIAEELDVAYGWGTSWDLNPGAVTA